MEAFTFDDFINAANGGDTESKSLEKFFKEPEPEPFKFNDPNKQPAAGGIGDLWPTASSNVQAGESLKINFSTCCRISFDPYFSGLSWQYRLNKYRG